MDGEQLTLWKRAWCTAKWGRCPSMSPHGFWTPTNGTAGPAAVLPRTPTEQRPVVAGNCRLRATSTRHSYRRGRRCQCQQRASWIRAGRLGGAWAFDSEIAIRFDREARCIFRTTQVVESSICALEISLFGSGSGSSFDRSTAAVIDVGCHWHTMGELLRHGFVKVQRRRQFTTHAHTGENKRARRWHARRHAKSVARLPKPCFT